MNCQPALTSVTASTDSALLRCLVLLLGLLLFERTKLYFLGYILTYIFCPGWNNVAWSMQATHQYNRAAEQVQAQLQSL
jgi:hypothetical protein